MSKLINREEDILLYLQPYMEERFQSACQIAEITKGSSKQTAKRSNSISGIQLFKKRHLHGQTVASSGMSG